MRCCLDLVRFLLFIINFAAFVGIGLALAFVVFVLLEPEKTLKIHVELNLSPDNPTALYFSLLLILVVVFGFLCLFTFLGCCGSACENRCMLGSFTIILFAFLVANVASIVYMYTQFPGGEVQMLTFELDKTIAYYKADDPDSIAKKFWDWLQPSLHCCGAASVFDWSAADLKAGHKVPASCCADATAGSLECVYNPSVDNGAFLTGCVSRMSFAWRIAFWTLPSSMAIILFFTLVVCSRDSRRTAPDAGYERRCNKPSGRAANQTYSEETGYVYRSSTPDYTRAPPYNPDYRPHSGYVGSVDQYPTGIIPPNDSHQPLMQQQQPPPYHDVVSRSRNY